ncbi:hypothetical protein V9T40_005867 [Parthenolecanium corni]|uniref:RNA-directed DNA polymerase n=1 Tax=Parthenolecanium corni TaxID=536013 RepID=A0AAN9TX24_9HEMI
MLWRIKDLFPKTFILDIERKLTPYDPAKTKESRQNNPYFEMSLNQHDFLKYSATGAKRLDEEMSDLIKKFIARTIEPALCSIGISLEDEYENREYKELIGNVNQDDDYTSSEEEHDWLRPDERDYSCYMIPESEHKEVNSCLSEEDLESADDDREEDKKKKKRHLYLAGIINGTNYHMLLDDGSEDCYITAEILESIEAKNKNINLAKTKFSNNSTGVAAGKTKLKVTYSVRIPFEIIDINGNKHFLEAPFRVVTNLNIPILLGLEFLGVIYGAVIDYKYRIVNLRLSRESDEITPFKVLTRTEILDIKKTMIIMPDIDLDVQKAIEKVVTEIEVTESTKIELKEFLIQNHTAFRDEITMCSAGKHHLVMDVDIPHMDPKERRIPFHLEEKVRKIVEKWVKDNVVTPDEQTDYYSPITTVKKPNGEYRVCIDSKEINKYMHSHGDAVPHIDELKAKFKGAGFFSKLDFRWGFLQIGLDDESRKYVAFKYKGRSYVFNRVAFGLQDSMSAFIGMLRKVLSGFENFISAYVDDILIYSKTEKEHLDHIKKIITRIKENNMNLSLEKCSFFKSQTKYLGFVINREGIKPDPDRAEAITNYATPLDKKQVRQFLGVVGYYRNHVPRCAHLSQPLIELTKDKIPFLWTEIEQKAFDELKREIANSILHTHPDWGKPFYIITDASDYAISGLIMQLDETGEQRIVAMCSRILKISERNYQTFEKELLAMVYTVKRNKYMLTGFDIHWKTDHQALTHFLKCEDSSQRVARWRAYLSNFKIKGIEHVPGKENVASDALSRHFEALRGPKDYSYPPVMFLGIDNHGQNTLESIIQNIEYLQKQSPDIRQAVIDDDKNIEIVGGVIYYKNRTGSSRIFAPQSLRYDFIDLFHRRYAHPGEKKTLAIVRRMFDWPGSKQDIEEYCKNCLHCRKSKALNYTQKGEYKPIFANEPLDLLSVDIFGPLPRTDVGYNKIIVLMDVFTKFTKLYPVGSASIEMCTKAIENFIEKYGKPKTILSDNAMTFTSPKWREYWENQNIQIRLTSVYTPSSNPVETRMRVIGDCLRIYCPTQHHRWDNFLDLIEKRLNETEHETTGFEPITLFLKKSIQPNGEIIDLNDDNLYQDMIVDARNNTRAAIAKRKKYIENKNFRFVKFETGDQVLVKNHQLSSAERRQAAKLFHKWVGPFTVLREPYKNTYIVADRQGSEFQYHVKDLQKI